MIWVLLLLSFVFVVFANIITRVDLTTIIYEYLPENYFLKNRFCLRLYVIYPKSAITKAGFALYISQLLLFICVLILWGLQITKAINISDEIIINIIKIAIIYIVSCFLFCFSFNAISNFIFKKKKNR